MKRLLVALVFVLCATSAHGVTNSLTITEKTGATQTNYPIQIGRPFVQGEIANYPQAIIAGTPVTTQADVKTRWGDGSVKHAILSFLIPTLTASSTVTVTFQNQLSGNNTAITKSAMLDPAYDFNAQMELTNGSTVSADARTMLNADAYTTWLSGSVSTCIILADHSAARAYDIGFDAYKSFRPIFHACFWPTINKVRVRFIGEIANTEALQDQIYSLVLKTGNAAPASRYTHDLWMTPPVPPTYASTTTFTIARGTCTGNKSVANYYPGKLMRFKTTASGADYVTARVSTCAGRDDPLPDLVTIDSAILDSGLNSLETAFTHMAATRWTKEYWINTAPTSTAINHNLAYLASTTLLPNWDTSKVVSETAIASAYTSWQSAAKDLYDAGHWEKYIPNTGGRPDIGPVPGWTVRWLYTGDTRMYDHAFGNADLAGAWPVHFREGDAAKYFDKAQTQPAIGRVVSISARPSVWLSRLTDWPYTSAADLITPVGTRTTGGWTPERAHHPDPFSAQYLLTGDFWYLEEQYFWGSWSAADCNAENRDSTVPGGRGPYRAGGIQDQVRGEAWTLRTRVHAAANAPDDAPENAYFASLIDDALAIWEGERNITSTAFYNTANWTWGNTIGGGEFSSCAGIDAVPSLHLWHGGSDEWVQAGYGLDFAVTKCAHSNWEQSMMLWALGRATELGYAADALRQWLGVSFIGQITDGTYSPYAVGLGRTPTASLSTGLYFTSWAAAELGFARGFNYASAWNAQLTAEHGYAILAMMAVSQIAQDSGGSAAWAFMADNALTLSALNDNPKLAIIPRATRPYAPVLRRIESQ